MKLTNGDRFTLIKQMVNESDRWLSAYDESFWLRILEIALEAQVEYRDFKDRNNGQK